MTDARAEGSMGGRPGRPAKQLDPTKSARALLGAELRRFRRQQRLVLADLSELTGYSTQHIGAVERGDTSPSERFVGDCDRALGAGGHLVELFSEVAREQAAVRHHRHDSGPRRTRLAGCPEVSGDAEPRSDSAPPIDWDRLESVVSGGFRATTRVIEDIGAITRQHRSLYHHLPSSSMLGPVTAHLQTTTALLRRAGSEKAQRLLGALAQETAGLLAWLRHDMADRAGAEAGYHLAADLMGTSGDRILGGYVTAFRASTYAARGDWSATNAQLDTARRQMGRAAPPMPLAWLYALRAEAAARTGDPARTRALLRRAELALWAAGSNLGVEWMYHFDEGRLAMYRGSCFLSVGRAAEAKAAFGEALAVLPESCVRHRADIMLRLALAHYESHDVTEALRLAVCACDGFVATGSAAGIRAIRRFHHEVVRGVGANAARTLDERLREYLRDSGRG